MNRRRAAVIAVVLVAAAACSSEGGSKPTTTASTPRTVRSTATPSPTPTESASVSAAKQVYLEFRKSGAVAERAPKSANYKALKTLAIDQAFSELQSELIAFGVNGLAFRGEPPTPRLTVISDEPAASPYPKVELKDCPTVSATWKPYNTTTNKPAKTVAAKVPPPYPTAATVILFKNRWTVQRTATDRTVTCTP